jgi:hypothetical protein
MAKGYNVNRESGFAPRQSWMRLNTTDTAEVTGQEQTCDINSTPADRRYAQLVYSVNSTPVVISGGVSANITSVGLDDSGMVGVSGDTLKVSDEAVVNAIDNISISETVYSQIIRVSGDYTYVMKSSPGAGTSGDAVWQIQRVESVGDNVDILWADGNANFDNVASGYLGLTYTL